MPRSDWKLVSKTEFFIPSAIGEQAAIGAYFEQLVGAATKRDIMDANPSISKRTVERVLKKLQDDGTIEKTGSARSTAYRKR